jgi:hypothetical protein
MVTMRPKDLGSLEWLGLGMGSSMESREEDKGRAWIAEEIERTDRRSREAGIGRDLWGFRLLWVHGSHG